MKVCTIRTVSEFLKEYGIKLSYDRTVGEIHPSADSLKQLAISDGFHPDLNYFEETLEGIAYEIQ